MIPENTGIYMGIHIHTHLWWSGVCTYIYMLIMLSTHKYTHTLTYISYFSVAHQKDELLRWGSLRLG